MKKISGPQLDRAAGAVLGSASGDALGAPYEFQPVPHADQPLRFGTGTFGHAPAEWTDDTSMAMPILRELAAGRRLEDTATIDRVIAGWLDWRNGAKDIGIQTGRVLSRVASGGEITEAAALAASESVRRTNDRSGGNGSLMRTGPVALGYLHRDPVDLAAAAARIARLTHFEDDNADAAALWSLAIRHAILTGELDVLGQLQHLPRDRRERWASIIGAALAPGTHPRDFAAKNGWVVAAFQGALSAIDGATSLVDALERAIRGGNDTDTVAAIAGSLAGALHGATAVPLEWHRVLHGWPGLRANDLVRLAVLAAREGGTDAEGWPAADRATVYPWNDWLFPHPHDDGVLVGSIAALDRLPIDVDAVVSLCRVGTSQVPTHAESIQVWLVDQRNRNLNLEQVLTEASDLVARLRAEGKKVFFHCAEARSRTASLTTLYSVRHCGVPLAQAWRDAATTLPAFNPEPFLREAIDRITTTEEAA